MPQLAPSLVAAAVRPVRWLTYTAAIAATLIGSLVVVRPASGAGDCTVSASDAAIDGDEQALLNGINAYRQQNGLPPLTLSSTLSRAAAWMSKDMAAKRYFDHTDSLGRDPFTRMRDCGYSASLMGENIAAGRADPTSTIEMWKSSPSHNKAMLTSGFRAAGIGRFSDPSSPYRVYWTLDLGSMVDGGSGLPVTTTTTSPTTTYPTTTTTYPTFPIQNTTTTYPTIPIQPATTTYPTVPIQTTATAPFAPATSMANATTATSAQPGVITFGVSLVNAAGQVTQGDLSGYIFSITTPSGAAYSTPPTNAMGQTSLMLPAGTYTVTQLPKAGSAVMSITGAAGPGGTVTVSPGANAYVSVLNQIGGATQTTTQATTTQTSQTSVTTGAPSFVPATTATNGTTSYTPATTTTTTTTTTTAATTATTMETVSLLAGCNNVSMTWSAGTPMSMVAASVTGGLKAIWRWDGARNTYLGYTTDPGAPTDYVAVGAKYEPAFVCMRTPGSLTRPVA